MTGPVSGLAFGRGWCGAPVGGVARLAAIRELSGWSGRGWWGGPEVGADMLLGLLDSSGESLDWEPARRRKPGAGPLASVSMFWRPRRSRRKLAFHAKRRRQTHRFRTGVSKVHSTRLSRHSLHVGAPDVGDTVMSSHFMRRLGRGLVRAGGTSVA